MNKIYVLESDATTGRPIPGKWSEYTPVLEGPFADSTWPYTMRSEVRGLPTYTTWTKAYAIISKGAFLCKNLQIILCQRNSGDVMALGIYDANYQLRARTDNFTLGSISGNIADIPLQTPFQVTAKSMYYIGFGMRTSAPNNTTFPVIAQGDVLTTQPLSQITDESNFLPNSMGIGNIYNQYSVWMGWSA